MARDTTRHSREGIVDVALRLLDEYGIADLSMRRLAGELDVQPSALYWHFESKQALLAALADRIVGTAEDTEPSSATRPDAVTVAIEIREALLSRRDGAEVVLSTYALALGAGAAHERLRVALTDAADPDLAAAAVLQFTLGNASVVQQRLHAQRFGILDMTPEHIRAIADREFASGVAALVS